MMKRLLILLLCIVSAVSIYANPPKLNVENLFDGRYNNNKSVTISIYKNNGNYYRGLTIKNNPEIIKQIAEAIAKDQPRAKDFSDYQGEDGQYTSLQIENNGEIIYIGLQRDKAGGGFLFIQGKEKAFK
jgi:lipopolysaccharide export LptBFGC system permease protein LptF